MSIQNLLNPDTQQEEWAKIYVNKINGIDFSVPTAPVITENIMDVPSFTFLQGVGNIQNLSSILITNGAYNTLTGAFKILNFTAPAFNGNSLALLEYSLPGQGAINYPAQGEPVPGASNVTVFQSNPDLVGTPSSSIVVNQQDFQISLSFANDLSVANITREVNVNFTITYRT